MAEIIRPPDAGLLDKLVALERRVKTLERMPSGLASVGPDYLAIVPNVRVTHSVLQTATASVELALAFDTERWDPTGMHDPAANTRITFNRAGVYRVGFGFSWTGNATGVRLMRIRLNGLAGTVLAEVSLLGFTGSSNDGSLVTEYRFAAGDFVVFTALQTTAGTLDVLQGANFSPEAWASFVSR